MGQIWNQREFNAQIGSLTVWRLINILIFGLLLPHSTVSKFSSSFHEMLNAIQEIRSWVLLTSAAGDSNLIPIVVEPLHRPLTAGGGARASGNSVPESSVFILLFAIFWIIEYTYKMVILSTVAYFFNIIRFTRYVYVSIVHFF